MDLFDIIAARQGGSGGGAPQVQSDWTQYDESQKDYIKNRPFYEDEIVMPYTETSLSITFNTADISSYHHDRLYLISGETYVITGELPDGTTLTTEAVAYTLPSSESYLEKDLVSIENKYMSIIDGVKLNTSNSDIAIDENTSVALPKNSVLYNCNIYIEGKFGEKTLKKIDKKFLPITEISVATQDRLGGVKPYTALSSDTQQVGVDSNGRLWTQPNTFTSVSLDTSAGASGNAIRHPVYRNSDNKLFANVLTASSTSVGGVKVNGQVETLSSERLSCFMSGGYIYANLPTAATTIDSTSTSFPTTKAVYEYVADQINTIYADLEGDAY